MILHQPLTSGLQANEAHCPGLYTFPAVQFGPDIKVEVELLARSPLVLARVKVNNVFDLCAASIDDPVMSIERRLVANQRIKSGTRCEF